MRITEEIREKREKETIFPIVNNKNFKLKYFDKNGFHMVSYRFDVGNGSEYLEKSINPKVKDLGIIEYIFENAMSRQELDFGLNIVGKISESY